MFGIADNQDGQTTGAGGAPATTAAPLDSSHPAADASSVSSEPSTGVPEVPQSTLPTTAAPATSATAASSGDTALETPAADTVPTDTTTATAMPAVHLENSYIMTDGPHLSGASDDKATKPTTATVVTEDASRDLLQLKQQALQNLEPLVDKLEQTPEEKFKTTMMLIQASDNAELVKEAYEAANAIPDEKIRAQALLDVVNEINYFTQHQQS